MIATFVVLIICFSVGGTILITNTKVMEIGVVCYFMVVVLFLLVITNQHDNAYSYFEENYTYLKSGIELSLKNGITEDNIKAASDFNKYCYSENHKGTVTHDYECIDFSKNTEDKNGK